MVRDAPPPALLPPLLSLLGLTGGLALGRSLPVVPSALLCALVLAGGTSLSGRLRQPSRWWGLIGLAAGCLLGTSWGLTRAVSQIQPGGDLEGRGLILGLMLAAGAVAGIALERAGLLGAHRRPSDLLRGASSLTAGLFAALVTAVYLHSGLELARAFSSRLSTSLTILVLCLTAPGWFSHQLRRQWRLRREASGAPAAEVSPGS